MHGYAYGFAIDISSAADIGMAAGIGVLSRLPKIVGSFGWVKEVAISARIFGAEEALRMGFVNAVHNSKAATVQAALDLAELISQKSPVAVLGTKELLNYSRDHSISEGLRYTAVWNSGAIQTGDVSAALMSSMEKRIPRFDKL